MGPETRAASSHVVAEPAGRHHGAVTDQPDPPDETAAPDEEPVLSEDELDSLA